MATNLWDTHLKSANCLISDYLNEYPLTENDSSSFSLCCCAWPTGPMTRSILCPPVISQPQRWMPALLGACELDFYDQVSYDMRCIMDSWRICRNGEILDHTGRCHFFLFSEWLSTWSGQHTYVSKLHVHKKSCFQSQACVSYSRILSTEPFSLLVLWDLLMQKGTPGSWLLPACNEGWCHVRNIRRVKVRINHYSVWVLSLPA